jgi:hypothetical protein
VPSLSSEILIFNIIRTNKNKTAIAPTYTIRNVIGKNSRPSKKRRTDKLKKDKIRNRTENTGFFEITTINDEIIPNPAKI